MTGASRTELSTLFSDSAGQVRAMGLVWVAARDPLPGLRGRRHRSAVEGRLRLGSPPPPRRRRHGAKALWDRERKSVGLSSWMRASGRQYLDSKSSGKSQY